MEQRIDYCPACGTPLFNDDRCNECEWTIEDESRPLTRHEKRQREADNGHDTIEEMRGER